MYNIRVYNLDVSRIYIERIGFKCSCPEKNSVVQVLIRNHQQRYTGKQRTVKTSALARATNIVRTSRIDKKMMKKIPPLDGTTAA